MKKTAFSQLLLVACLTCNLFQSKAQYTNLSVPFPAGIDDIGYLSVPAAGKIWGTAFDAPQSQTFARSADDGLTWKVGVIPTPTTDWEIASIFALDGNTAWVTFFNNTTGTFGAIYKTTDGGTTWNRQGTQSLFLNATTSFANWTHFWDANEGVTMGDPADGYFEIWRTLDGGANWTRVPSANIPAPVSGEYGLTDGDTAIGDTIWFVTNKGNCFRSTNRGLNWQKFPTGHSGYFKVYFRDHQNGLAVRNTGSNPSLFRRSSDGGATWSAADTATVSDPMELVNGNFYMRHADYVPNTNILVGVGKEVPSNIELAAASYDGGQTFKVIEFTAGDFSYVVMLSTTLGYLGGLDDDNKPAIFRFDGNLTGTQEPLLDAAPIKVLGNPFSEELAFQLLENLDGTASLFGLDGKLIQSKTLRGMSASDVVNFELSDGNSGVFVLKIQTEKGVFAVKAVKE